MPPTLRPVLSLVSAALVLTACGGSEEPSADPEPSPSAPTSAPTSSSTEPSPSSEPAPTTPAADTTADPCSLLEAADYAALVDEQARDLVAEQIGQYGPFMGCRVYWQVYAGLTYGFAIDPDAFDEATAAPEPGESAEAVDVAGAERASLTTGTDGSIAVHAEAGGTTFLVAQGGTDDGDTAMSRGSTQDVLDVAATLVANGAGRISSTAVLLPDTCPAADATVTTDLLGTVEYARGGSNPQGIAACGYAGADGAGAGSSYTFLAPAIFEREYGAADGAGAVVVDPAPGVRKTWSRTGAGTYRYRAYYPGSQPQLVLELDASGITGPQADERFLAWAEAYLAANEPPGQP